MNGLSEITLAVPTYNQADLLRAFIDRFEKRAPSGLLLLIVDDGSTDATGEILRLAQKPGHIESRRIHHAGAAAARNEAFAACQTPWLAFTDTDCILDADYFAVLATLPRRYADAIAVEGAIDSPAEPKKPLTHWLENANGGAYATANMLFKVEIARSEGGFDAGFPSNLREDTDFGLTLFERHGPIPFCREWKVHHPHVHRDFKSAWRRSMSRQGEIVIAETRLYAKHPQTYRRVRRFSNAHQTLNWWRKWHALFYARTLTPWLLHNLRQKPHHALSILWPWLKAITLALYEQACLNLQCLRRSKTRFIA